MFVVFDLSVRAVLVDALVLARRQRRSRRTNSGDET